MRASERTVGWYVDDGRELHEFERERTSVCVNYDKIDAFTL